MRYIPNGLSRFVSRSALKVSANSPTILVVAGVVGFGTTAVLAAKATRHLDPILEKHVQKRVDVVAFAESRTDERQQLIRLYSDTGLQLAKLYGPTLVVGTLSTASVLAGHRIISRRHVATMAAYSGLVEQFNAYRARVADTLGSDVERGLYDGAVGEWQYNEEKGRDELVPKWGDTPDSYLRPFFDETNRNWVRNPSSNYYFLKGVQSHCQDRLEANGHLFLADVLRDIGVRESDIPREAIVTGWLWQRGGGDNFVDFGFMTEQTPQAVAFRNHVEGSVRLNFNIDGVIWDLI